MDIKQIRSLQSKIARNKKEIAKNRRAMARSILSIIEIVLVLCGTLFVAGGVDSYYQHFIVFMLFLIYINQK